MTRKTTAKKPLTCLRIAGSALLLTLTIAAPTRAEQAKKVVRFGVMGLTPYGYFDENKKPHGDLFEISHAILKQGNFAGKVVIEPIKRLTRTFLVEKALDCFIAGDVPYIRDRYQEIESTGIDVEFGFLPYRDVVINSYADVQKLDIGLPLGVTLGHAFDKDSTVNKVSVRDYETGVLMLSRKRIDALAGVMGSLRFSGKKNGVSSDAYGKPFITKKVPLKLFCRHDYGDEALKAEIGKAATALRENGTMRRIVRRYR